MVLDALGAGAEAEGVDGLGSVAEAGRAREDEARLRSAAERVLEEAGEPRVPAWVRERERWSCRG